MVHRLSFCQIEYLLHISCKYCPKYLIILVLLPSSTYGIKFSTLFQIQYGQRKHRHVHGKKKKNNNKKTIVILKLQLCLSVISQLFLSFRKISFYARKDSSDFKRLCYHNPIHPRIDNFLHISSLTKVVSIFLSMSQSVG